jgi:ribonuclease P protein component
LYAGQIKWSGILMNYTFGKNYKLCSKKTIEQLYQSGREVKSFPFYLKYGENPSSKNAFQIVFVVPKKKFKLATTRNQIRRYIREAVRLEKNLLEEALAEHNLSMALFLVYAGDENLTLASARKGIAKLLKKLIYDIEQNNNQ